jgi:hypothetical protein
LLRLGGVCKSWVLRVSNATMCTRADFGKQLAQYCTITTDNHSAPGIDPGELA